MTCGCRRSANTQGVCPHGHEVVKVLECDGYIRELSPECCVLCKDGATLDHYKEASNEETPEAAPAQTAGG